MDGEQRRLVLLRLARGLSVAGKRIKTIGKRKKKKSSVCVSQSADAVQHDGLPFKIPH